mmetsp:Transcript_11124/g.33347  ORF Transcript_11124/g.33347 Transcript_11124/m.33347 type:complete len:210 (-) Transcript_11124:596-1225(-)
MHTRQCEGHQAVSVQLDRVRVQGRLRSEVQGLHAQRQRLPPAVEGSSAGQSQRSPFRRSPVRKLKRPAAWIPATAIAIATSGNPVSEPPPAEGERGVPAPRAILEQVLPQAGCQVVVHGSRVRLQDYEGDQIAAPLCVVRHAPSPLEAITPAVDKSHVSQSGGVLVDREQPITLIFRQSNNSRRVLNTQCGEVFHAAPNSAPHPIQLCI